MAAAAAVAAATTAGDPLQGLQKAAVCSICLDYFKEPVSIDCGHNFCLGCITQCCEKYRRRFFCPHCRRRAFKRDFRPNRDLANMVEIAKRFKLPEEQAAAGEGWCEKHREPLKLFCEDDETLICVVCDRSKEHRAHAVLPLEEAALGYKEEIQNQLQNFKEERQKLQEQKQADEGTAEENLGKLESERKKVVSEFELLHQFLEEMQQSLMYQFHELEKDIKKGQKESDTRFTEDISVLEDLITELEEKCKQSDSDFLQNIKETLTRYKKRQCNLSLEITPDPRDKLSSFARRALTLSETVKKFKDLLLLVLHGKEEDLLPTTDVTLDLATAGPYLIISDSRKSVRMGDTRQKRADSQNQINVYPSVLGCPAFTSGKHAWEVQVVKEGCWAVGVARESVKRKHKLNFRPEDGIWALEHLGADQYRALTSPPTPLPPGKIYRRVRVFLDYEQGQVAFFDAGNNNCIFRFPSSSFGGARIHPWLWVGHRSQVRLYP
uniref:Uncharacterized protein n=1 Tax=Salvator merianae TaxID=96440 RepID=A0A8D0AZH1_SALMN